MLLFLGFFFTNSFSALNLCSALPREEKMLVYPETNGASLIAIPTVMAKDEADQQPSTPIPKAITLNGKTHLLLLTFALFCFTIRTGGCDEDGIGLEGLPWLWICIPLSCFYIQKIKGPTSYKKKSPHQVFSSNNLCQFPVNELPRNKLYFTFWWDFLFQTLCET